MSTFDKIYKFHNEALISVINGADGSKRTDAGALAHPRRYLSQAMEHELRTT